MGTDIYEVIEIRREGQWEVAHLLPLLDTNKSFSDPEWEKHWSHPAFINRNYRLFSVLANVRNSFGIPPIDTARGLPQDASAESRQRFSYHSYSPTRNSPQLTWVSLRELLAYDWDQWTTDSRHGHEPPRSLREEVEPFYSITLPYLRSLVKNPDDLRLICDFD
ncbi:hypothetical protein [Deinococcus enclensis]|uniref:Uncharacterized protein n=1 Tax=Deinococcus enclensis TaxID=1049582 RepID=A0ABT9MAY7_9DEIO|nr:hypothetical protein [Deinococcus enclensis]MDP9763674.1 hypothetical protein [Deinococcus enclensis]